MNYQLNLKEGKVIDLRFSMYFINRFCKLANKSIQDVFNLIMEIDKDLEVMAMILAASREAQGFSKGDFKQYTAVDGFDMMDNMPNFLQNAQVWLDIAQLITNCLVPDLPKDNQTKKKAVPKKGQ